jgi:hypothetical protein
MENRRTGNNASLLDAVDTRHTYSRLNSEYYLSALVLVHALVKAHTQESHCELGSGNDKFVNDSHHDRCKAVADDRGY